MTKSIRLTFTTGNLGGNRIENHVRHEVDNLLEYLGSQVEKYEKSLSDIMLNDDMRYLTHMELANLHKLKCKLRDAIWEEIPD
tara:strand:+ start:66 stop:314 length:249 start_codon:yes stop_codon:yes gene_type:complete